MHSLCGKLCFLLIVACAALWGENTSDSERQQAIRFVNKAIEFAEKNGKDSLLRAINQTNSEFLKNEMYVFAYDTNGNIIAHPVNSKIIGKNLLDIPDIEGKFFRREIVEKGKIQDTAWIDYRYKNPDNGIIENKSTFIHRIGGIIIACGIYRK